LFASADSLTQILSGSAGTDHHDRLSTAWTSSAHFVRLVPLDQVFNGSDILRHKHVDNFLQNFHSHGILPP